MISKTAIANQALTRLGDWLIQDIDDSQSVPSVRIKTIFDQSVRELGRMYPFRCLQARQQLTVNAAAPDFGYNYSYNLPDNWLRMITLNDIDAWDNDDWYEIEGRTLLTDHDEAKIVYTQYVDDSTKYDPLFVAALVVYLAAKLAKPIAGDEDQGRLLMAEFKQMAFPNAAVVDGDDDSRRPRKPTDRSEWIQGRRYNKFGWMKSQYPW